jgi:CheY-like chemotaxis protein
MAPEPIQILLVEDSEDDVLLTREVLRDAKVANELSVVGDGDAALAFVRGEAPYEDRPAPDVILLDLNLPRRDGREVLAELKADPELALIPVVVLTTSSAERDVMSAYEHRVNAYVTKPIEFGELVETLRSFEDFWLSIVKLPKRAGR